MRGKSKGGSLAANHIIKMTLSPEFDTALVL